MGTWKITYSKCVKYEMSTNVYVNVSKKNRLVKFTRKKNRLVSFLFIVIHVPVFGFWRIFRKFQSKYLKFSSLSSFKMIFTSTRFGACDSQPAKSMLIVSLLGFSNTPWHLKSLNNYYSSEVQVLHILPPTSTKNRYLT